MLLETDRNLPQPDEHADTVVHVHDVVADLQVAKVGQEGTGRSRAPFAYPPFLVEDIRLSEDLQPGVRQPEPPRQLSGRHEQCCPVGLMCPIDRLRSEVVLPQQLDEALGASRGSGDQQRGFAALSGPPDLGDPVCQPTVELHHGLAGYVPHGIRTALVLR